MLISLFQIYLLIFVDIFHLYFQYSFVVLRISYVKKHVSEFELFTQTESLCLLVSQPNALL